MNFRDGKDLSVTVDGITASIDPETRVSTVAFVGHFTPREGLPVDSNRSRCINKQTRDS